MFGGVQEQHAVWRPPRVLLGLTAAALIALLIIACITWATPHIARVRTQRPIIADIEASGGAAYFDYQMTGHSIRPHNPPPGPSIVRAIFGDDVFATVNVVTFMTPTVTDTDVARLAGLPELKELCLTGPRITDGCIDALLRIKNLRSLTLCDTAIEPSGLSQLSASRTLQALTLYGASVKDEHLEELANFSDLHYLQVIRASTNDRGAIALGRIRGLKSLDLYSAGVLTDVGVAGLQTLANLESLGIMSNTITDASLVMIGSLGRLRHLRLWGKFSDEAVAQLKMQLPACSIERHEFDGENSENDAAP